MLILGRKPNERVLLRTSDGPIWVTVMDMDRGRVRLLFDAPASVTILREEIIESDKREK